MEAIGHLGRGGSGERGGFGVSAGAVAANNFDPDRTAETLATWLRAHPGVEVISRDRAGTYAEGGQAGAPHALQVLDRWHLLTNMGEVVERVVARRERQWRAALQPPPAAAPADPTPPLPVGGPPPAERPSLTNDGRCASPQRERRQRRYDTIQTLRQQGWTISAIARHLALDRKTVRRLVTAPTCPQGQGRATRRRRGSLLDPYKSYLWQRWNEGCLNGSQLWREIAAQGYGGSRTLVTAYTAYLRRQQGWPARARQVQSAPQARQATEWSVPAVKWCLLRSPAELSTRAQAAVAACTAADAELARTYELAQECADMVRQRQEEKLTRWLESAAHSGLAEWRRFAASLAREEAGVRAALREEWSNGPVEGQVNRLKMLKRAMFGRANFDLLRLRVLYHDD